MGRKAKEVSREDLDLIGNDSYSIKELNKLTGISSTRLRVIRDTYFGHINFSTHYRTGRNCNIIICCVCGKEFETYKSDDVDRTCSQQCKNLNRNNINSKIAESNKEAWKHHRSLELRAALKDVMAI